MNPEKQHVAANSLSPQRAALLAFQREILSWTGVIGSVMTIVSGIEDLVGLAHWANWLVENFFQLTVLIWSKILFIFPRLSPLAAWLLNLTTFFVITAVSSLRKDHESGPRKASTDAMAGLGLVCIFAFAFISLIGSYSASELSGGDYQVLHSMREWIASRVPQQAVYIVAMLVVILPLVFLMNLIGWCANMFGYGTDQALAVARIWRINLGILLLLVLSHASILLREL